jgi:AbrB family looped-hinge helix DNA binding protein
MVKKILGTSKLSHKNQVTVPKDVRETFKLEANDIVVFAEENGKLTLSKNVEQ